MKNFNLKTSRKAYQRFTDGIYVLRFNSDREEEIIQYLETLPNVKYVQRDFKVQLLAEPNDFYYQPDSTDYSNHWVPTSLSSPNKDLGRICTSGDGCGLCCLYCPENIQFYDFSYFDNLHLNDQWYLQHVQANKAWDIEKGDPCFVSDSMGQI